ncbi:MAG: hypothetical protein Q9164_006512 [Protoblastenia rupestris]
MDRLPQELIKVIVGYVHVSDNYSCRMDLCNLRLVNKTFAFVVTSELFHTVPLWIGVSGLQNLTNISEHPQLSQLVRKIAFSPLRFVEQDDKVGNRARMKRVLERDSITLNNSDLRLVKYESAYKGFLMAQDCLEEQGSDSKILTRALRQLPQICNIEVILQSNWIGAKEISQAFGTTHGEECEFYCEHTLPVLFQSLFDASRKLIYLRFTQNDFQDKGANISKGDRSTHRRCYAPVNAHSIDTPSVAAMKDTFGQKHNWTGCLEHLRVFEFRRYRILREHVLSQLEVVEVIKGMLENAPNLENLTLGALSTFGDICPKIRLSRLLGGIRLPKLTRFELHDLVEERPEEISDFFTQHCSVLEEVNLHDLTTSAPNGWSHVLRIMRQAKFQKLRLFTLDGCIMDEEYLHVQDYLNHKTDKDPVVEYWQAKHDDH